MSRPRESTVNEPRRPAKPSVLYKDDQIAVVNKPASVWPREGVFDEPGVADLFSHANNVDAPSTQQVTPLDYDVSGCVVYAFAHDAAETLREQFADGRAIIQYDCVVNGPLITTSGEIEAEVPTTGTDAAANNLIRPETSGIPRTTWRAIDTFVAFARIECTPCPAHDLQVRVHLQHTGLSLAVDQRHGGAKHLMLSSFKAGYRRSRRHDERPLIQRPSLHAKSIAFKHPTTGEPVSFEAEPAKDYRALLYQLDRFGRVPK